MSEKESSRYLTIGDGLAVSFSNSSGFEETNIQKISRKGCFIQTDKLGNHNEVFTLSLLFPDDLTETVVRVKTIGFSKSKQYPGMFVDFLSLNDLQEKKIADLMSETVDDMLKLDGSERREVDRVKTEFRVVAYHFEGKIEVSVLDISLKGLQFETTIRFKTEDKLRLEISNPVTLAKEYYNGTVVRREKSQVDTQIRFQYGFVFDWIDLNKKQHLKSVMVALLRRKQKHKNRLIEVSKRSELAAVKKEIEEQNRFDISWKRSADFPIIEDFSPILVKENTVGHGRTVKEAPGRKGWRTYRYFLLGFPIMVIAWAFVFTLTANKGETGNDLSTVVVENGDTGHRVLTFEQSYQEAVAKVREMNSNGLTPNGKKEVSLKTVRNVSFKLVPVPLKFKNDYTQQDLASFQKYKTRYLSAGQGYRITLTKMREEASTVNEKRMLTRKLENFENQLKRVAVAEHPADLRGDYEER